MTGSVPEALMNRPRLNEHQTDLAAAYYFIKSGGGVSLNEIKAYCEIFSVPDLEYFTVVMRAVDRMI